MPFRFNPCAPCCDQSCSQVVLPTIFGPSILTNSGICYCDVTSGPTQVVFGGVEGSIFSGLDGQITATVSSNDLVMSLCNGSYTFDICGDLSDYGELTYGFETYASGPFLLPATCSTSRTITRYSGLATIHPNFGSVSFTVTLIIPFTSDFFEPDYSVYPNNGANCHTFNVYRRTKCNGVYTDTKITGVLATILISLSGGCPPSSANTGRVTYAGGLSVNPKRNVPAFGDDIEGFADTGLYEICQNLSGRIVYKSKFVFPFEIVSIGGSISTLYSRDFLARHHVIRGGELSLQCNDVPVQMESPYQYEILGDYNVRVSLPSSPAETLEETTVVSILESRIVQSPIQNNTMYSGMVRIRVSPTNIPLQEDELVSAQNGDTFGYSLYRDKFSSVGSPETSECALVDTQEQWTPITGTGTVLINDDGRFFVICNNEDIEHEIYTWLETNSSGRSFEQDEQNFNTLCHILGTNNWSTQPSKFIKYGVEMEPANYDACYELYSRVEEIDVNDPTYYLVYGDPPYYSDIFTHQNFANICFSYPVGSRHHLVF